MNHFKQKVIVFICGFCLNSVMIYPLDIDWIITGLNDTLTSEFIITKSKVFQFKKREFKYEVSRYINTSNLLKENWETSDIEIKKHRGYIAYKQNSIYKLGLQQISFGYADYLRPLDWFDTLDPLTITPISDGVKALSRTRLKKNHNTKQWLLYENNEIQENQYFESKNHTTEYGGFYQLFKKKSEHLISYHYRQIQDISTHQTGQEFRVGTGHFFDKQLPLWFEQSMSINQINHEKTIHVQAMAGFEIKKPYIKHTTLQIETMLEKTNNTNLGQQDWHSVLELCYEKNGFETINWIIFLDELHISEQLIKLKKRTQKSSFQWIYYIQSKTLSMSSYWNF